MTSKLLLSIIVVCFCQSNALFADDFYKGKVIRVIVGGSAGGGLMFTRWR